MKRIKIVLALAFFVSCLSKDLDAQQPMNTSRQLDEKQQSIVAISAFTAKSDMPQLEKALNTGLDAGLTVNEIKEVLVQLYAYTGFPKSLNALNSFIAVLKERKSKGINDKTGKEPSPLPTNKSRLQFGTEMQTKLVGQPVKGEVYQFAPAIDQFLKEHLFGDIFGRDNLDWKTRELATIAALATLGGVENQLRSHFGVGIYNGLTQPQLNELVSIVRLNVGTKEGKVANEVLQSVVKQRQNNTANEVINHKAEVSSKNKTVMVVRISEIEIHREDLQAYKAILKEEAEASVLLEPGVISIFPMYKKTDSTQVRILEIYRSKEAYESHLKTPHFQKYKGSTLDMVKSLQLMDMEAIDTETMNKIFSKLHD